MCFLVQAMSFSRFAGLALPWLAAVLLCLLASDAPAAPRHGELVSSLGELFPRQAAPGAILAAARRLFWTLASMSLVWSFGVLLLRRADIGEVLLELFRFMVFTGLFYWLLSGASTADGFIYAVFDSFKLMSGVNDAATRGDNIVQLGLDIFYKVLEQSQNWKEADMLVAAGLSVAIVVALTLLAAQIALIVVMAWMLAYGGIFLLGMGGARWTSPIAIGFYKHVLALGMALLVLALLLKVGQGFLQAQASRVLVDGSNAKGLDYVSLADMFVVALLLSVLGIKLPGLVYTVVTGSRLGLLAGTAGMAGSVLATGGGQLYATAYSALYPPAAGPRGYHGAGAGPDGSPGGGGAMQAIYRAAGRAPVEEAIFEPFGRRSPAGAVFSQRAAQAAPSHAQPSAMPAAAPHTDLHRGPSPASVSEPAAGFTAGHASGQESLFAVSENRLQVQRQASVAPASPSQEAAGAGETRDMFAPHRQAGAIRPAQATEPSRPDHRELLSMHAPRAAAPHARVDRASIPDMPVQHAPDPSAMPTPGSQHFAAGRRSGDAAPEGAALAHRPGSTASRDHSALAAANAAMETMAPEQLTPIGTGMSDASSPHRHLTGAEQIHSIDAPAPDPSMPPAAGAPPLHGPPAPAEQVHTIAAPMPKPSAQQAGSSTQRAGLPEATALHRMPAAEEPLHAADALLPGQPTQETAGMPAAPSQHTSSIVQERHRAADVGVPGGASSKAPVAPGSASPPQGQLAAGTAPVADAFATGRDASNQHARSSTASAGDEGQHAASAMGRSLPDPPSHASPQAAPNVSSDDAAAQRESAAASPATDGYRSVPGHAGGAAPPFAGISPDFEYATPSARLDMENAPQADESAAPMHESSTHRAAAMSTEDLSMATPAPRDAGIGDRSTPVPDAAGEEPVPADPLDGWAYGIKPVLPGDELPSHASDEEIKAFRDRPDRHGDSA
ncbi:hypothetical protein GCM10009429_06630 [Dyella marensis]